MNLYTKIKASMKALGARRGSLSSSFSVLDAGRETASLAPTNRNANSAEDFEISAGNAFLSHPQTQKTRKDRKLASLKRVGLFGEDTHGATITRACTLEDLGQAYRLVYQVYLGTGYITPDHSEMRLRMFEARPDTATFIAKVGDRIVGVLSLVPDSEELGLPSDLAFKVELDEMRKQGLRLCEATNQVVAEDYRKSAVPTELMRCAAAHVTKFGYDEMIATVSPSHNGFYDMLRFREFGSVRSYSQDIDDPVVALSMNTEQYFTDDCDHEEWWRFVRRLMTEQNHFLPHIYQWAEASRKVFLNPLLLRQLFVTETSFIDRCSSAEQRVLGHLWGRRMLAAVTGRTVSAVIQEAMTTGLCWIDTMFLHWSLRPAGFYPRIDKGMAS